MSLLKRVTSGIIITMFVGSLLFTTSCARHPNEEQIKKLEETRTAALSAEQKLEEKRQERQKLEQKLQESKQKLDKVKKDLETVRERVKNWQGE